MEKVQSNNPGAIRSPLVADAAKRSAADPGSGSTSQGAQQPNSGVEGGKPLPPSASQRLDAAAAKDRQQVEEAANKVNEYAKQQQREVRFSVDQDLGRPVVKVVDSSRDVVVRQIPSEVVIRLARNLEEYMEYSEYSGASAPADSEQAAVATNVGEASGLGPGIEPGQLINTNV